MLASTIVTPRDKYEAFFAETAMGSKEKYSIYLEERNEIILRLGGLTDFWNIGKPMWLRLQESITRLIKRMTKNV